MLESKGKVLFGATMENVVTLKDEEPVYFLPTGNIEQFSIAVLQIIQKYASADLLGKVQSETLRKTFADLWQTLEAIPVSALIADGGEICPKLGLDVLVLKDPRFANRTGKVGPLPNDGKGTFDQDALRTMASAMINYFSQTDQDSYSVPFGNKEEDSYALIFLPEKRQTILASCELTLAA